MRKITAIRLTYEDGGETELYRDSTRWLFVAQGYGVRQVSLSGDSPSDAFLLLILQMAVTQTLSSMNKITKGDLG
jgi:hypothetical protein